MGMRLVGPESRAREVRNAANRLRWEIDYALGLADGERHRPSDVRSIVQDVAETLAILRQTLEAIDEHLPAEDDVRVLGGTFREELARALDWYRKYHEVGR